MFGQCGELLSKEESDYGLGLFASKKVRQMGRASLTETDRWECRVRRLPALSLLVLERVKSMPDVYASLQLATERKWRGRGLLRVSSEALCHARSRLGVEPLQVLFRKTAEDTGYGHDCHFRKELRLESQENGDSALVHGRPPCLEASPSQWSGLCLGALESSAPAPVAWPRGGDGGIAQSANLMDGQHVLELDENRGAAQRRHLSLPGRHGGAGRPGHVHPVGSSSDHETCSTVAYHRNRELLAYLLMAARTARHTTHKGVETSTTVAVLLGSRIEQGDSLDRRISSRVQGRGSDLPREYVRRSIPLLWPGSSRLRSLLLRSCLGDLESAGWAVGFDSQAGQSDLAGLICYRLRADLNGRRPNGHRPRHEPGLSQRLLPYSTRSNFPLGLHRPLRAIRGCRRLRRQAMLDRRLRRRRRLRLVRSPGVCAYPSGDGLEAFSRTVSGHVRRVVHQFVRHRWGGLLANRARTRDTVQRAGDGILPG